MSLNHAYIGRVFPATTYEVSREKIREFADAMGAPDPAYRDPQAARAAGYADVLAPVTFPAVISMAGNQVIFDDPGLGLDFSRVVHGDQRFRYSRPIHAGDRLVCLSVIEDITTRSGHDFVTARSDIATADGEPVVTVWAKLVVRGEG